MEFLSDTAMVASLGCFLLFAAIGLNELIRRNPKKARRLAERITGRSYGPRNE